jgi:hypothetical protein
MFSGIFPVAGSRIRSHSQRRRADENSGPPSGDEGDVSSGLIRANRSRDAEAVRATAAMRRSRREGWVMDVVIMNGEIGCEGETNQADVK